MTSGFHRNSLRQAVLRGAALALVLWSTCSAQDTFTILGNAYLEDQYVHAGIEVEVWLGGSSQSVGATATTDASGSYTLSEVPALPGETFNFLSIVAVADGYRFDTIFVFTPDGAPGSVLLADNMVLKCQKNLAIEWVCQPNGTRTLTGALPSGTATLYSGVEGDNDRCGFLFASAQVTNSVADVYFIDERRDPWTFLANNGVGGVIDMGAVPLSEIAEAPLSGYESMGVDAILGHSYCVLSRHGSSYAKFRVGGVTTSGGWYTETVLRAEGGGGWTSLGLDGTESPHIGFCHFGQWDLMYANKALPDWAASTVDSEGLVGYGCSLNIDGSGRPHIVYEDATNNRIKYAHWNGVDWLFEEIGSSDTGKYNRYFSSALDSSGRPHVVYCKGAANALMYSYRDASGWHETPIVGSIGTHPGDVSIGVDQGGGVHIAYKDTNGYNLMYVSNLTGWIPETVDDSLWVGSGNSLAIDSSGCPHISYRDNGPLGLKYASRIAGLWQIAWADPSSNAWDTSLALGPNDVPYISYQEAAVDGEHDLLLAWRDASGWHTSVVDAVGDVGGTSSVSVTDAGAIHISYWDQTNDSLKYALSPSGVAVDSSAVFRVEGEGHIFADGTVRATALELGAADIAEWVRVSEPVEPGEVLEHDPRNPGCYRLSSAPFSPLVAGVASTDPGVILGVGANAIEQTLLALTGIVPTKVTNEGGAIRIGDLLVASPTPGHAMRWNGEDRSQCTLVGKALEPMHDERGVILVLLTAH